MSNAQLQSVLDHIDKDFDNSLERLFSLLRIKSISADPAFAKDCTDAAEHVATDHADGRKIFVARGAEDDKGQVMTFVEACRAWKKVTGSLPIDVTFLIEGEEEVGSKNFVPFIEANKDEFKADYVLVCDTGMWDRNTPAITP